MRILHVLDHSLPLHSGYTFRTVALLREQRALGWETFHLTSPKQGPATDAQEKVDDFILFEFFFSSYEDYFDLDLLSNFKIKKKNNSLKKKKKKEVKTTLLK